MAADEPAKSGRRRAPSPLQTLATRLLGHTALYASGTVLSMAFAVVNLAVLTRLLDPSGVRRAGHPHALQRPDHAAVQPRDRAGHDGRPRTPAGRVGEGGDGGGGGARAAWSRPAPQLRQPAAADDRARAHAVRRRGHHAARRAVVARDSARMLLGTRDVAPPRSSGPPRRAASARCGGSSPGIPRMERRPRTYIALQLAARLLVLGGRRSADRGRVRADRRHRRPRARARSPRLRRPRRQPPSLPVRDQPRDAAAIVRNGRPLIVHLRRRSSSPATSTCSCSRATPATPTWRSTAWPSGSARCRRSACRRP